MAAIIIEIVGWISAILILSAYILVSTGRLSGRSVLFQIMNMVGSFGFSINTAWHGAIPSMALNIVWCGMALWTLAQLTLRKPRPTHEG